MSIFKTKSEIEVLLKNEGTFSEIVKKRSSLNDDLVNIFRIGLE